VANSSNGIAKRIGERISSGFDFVFGAGIAEFSENLVGNIVVYGYLTGFGKKNIGIVPI